MAVIICLSIITSVIGFGGLLIGLNSILKTA